MSRIVSYAALLSVTLLLLLSGCVQGDTPKACSGVAQEKLANCVYVQSVLEQNPFFCYGISNIGVRKTCIGDSSNPAMKKKLTGMSQEERDLLLSNKTLPIPAPVIPQHQPAATPVATSPSGGTTGGAQNYNASAEQIIYNTAVESNEVTLCE
ncbi:MAG: hypothetical protein NT051_05730, partial [Candidatus Micrarchaeota archaeon]|nr:hypothetical protein [Candidatus Micrarchaeota archaeon]